MRPFICKLLQSSDEDTLSKDPVENEKKIADKAKDQWSLLNPEGKKQYVTADVSLCKLSSLPNLDIIKDKPHPEMHRRRQKGRGNKKQKNIVLPVSQYIKSENTWGPWFPAHKVEPTPDEHAEIEELSRKVRGILNKLTRQNFKCLVEQFKNLDISTEEKLTTVVDLFFENAISEGNFIVPCANMCKHLALIRVPLDGQPGQVQFRKLLITKCQKEFEQGGHDELKREERIKAIETAEPEKRKELQLDYDEKGKKTRMRYLGNIRFIGELFKLNMIIAPIMHECIKKLLAQGDEESLECLCHLLERIGKELDGKGNEGRKKRHRNVSNPMDQYFAQMQKIVDRRLTSSRVRFMLQDVLKKNNWIRRRDENNPETIDRIHKEAEKEAREAQQVFQNMPYSNKRVLDDRREMSGVDRLHQNLERMFTEGLHSDFILRVENSEFPVHRGILSARSAVFACMFQHYMSEKSSNAVDIPDCSADAFKVFLRYLYTGSVDTISSEIVLNLYYAADKYEVSDLMEYCVAYMKDNLSVDTFCDVIDLSLRHCELELQKVATQFFCDNIRKIIETVQWQNYLREYPTHANELFIKALNS